VRATLHASEVGRGIEQRLDRLGAVEEHGARAAGLELRLRVLTRTGLRAIRSRSSATASICPSRVIVLLIDSADSSPSRTLCSR